MSKQPFPNVKRLYDAEKRRRNASADGLPIGAWKKIIAEGIPNYQGTDQAIAEAFLQADTDGDSLLSFDEFYKCMTKPHLDETKKKEIKAVFESWDKTGDKKLSQEEIKTAAGDYRPETIQKILEKADKDGDGFITVAEFEAELFGK